MVVVEVGVCCGETGGKALFLRAARQQWSLQRLMQQRGLCMASIWLLPLFPLTCSELNFS